MMLRKALTTTAIVAMATTSVAVADEFTDAIVADLQSQNYDFIEIKDGPTQVKAEAVRDGRKVEVIFDRATGAILKQEFEAADADEIGRVGVEFDTRDEDFLDGDDLDDDEDDDDDDRDDDDDDRDDDDSDDDDSDDDDSDGDDSDGDDSEDDDEDDSDDD